MTRWKNFTEKRVWVDFLVTFPFIVGIFFLLDRIDTQTTCILYFRTFWFLPSAVVVGAVGRLGCRRRRRRIRCLHRDRSLLVVRPFRKLLRVAPHGKSPVGQNEAMEVWRSVRPPAGLRSRKTYDSPPPKVAAHPVSSSRKRGPSPLWTSHRRNFARHCCRRPSARYHFLPSLQPASTATARSSFLATRRLPPPRCSLPLIFYLNFHFLRLHLLSTIFTTSPHHRNHNSTTLITTVVRRKHAHDRLEALAAKHHSVNVVDNILEWKNVSTINIIMIVDHKTDYFLFL